VRNFHKISIILVKDLLKKIIDDETKKNILLFHLLFLLMVLASCEQKDLNIPLQDHKWKVVKIKKAGNSRFLKATKQYIIEFKNHGSYRLTLDVNACGGNYEVTAPGKIRFDGIMCTEICCDSDFGITLSQLLPGMTSYYMKGDYLRLKGEGEIVLEPK